MKNTSLISGCGALDVTSLSYRASDEHPMSTRSASDGGRSNSRGWKYVACMLMVFVLSIGQMWATDFDITLDQFRTKPISGLVKIDDSNLSLSGGALQLSSGNKDFTVSTTNSDYKIKKIVFTTTKAVIKYSGDEISENTFQPATPGTSFTLNLTASGGTAKITQMVVTLTTATSETLEELFATALDGTTYTTGSTALTLTTVGGGFNAAYINVSKSSNERSLTISAASGTNIKFVAIYYYDAIFSRSITASTGAYDADTYNWTPGSTPTNTVTLTFNTGNSEGAKIRKIYVGYEAAGGGEEPAAGDYDATFNNGGHGTAPDDAENVASVTLEELSADGYVHVGWTADEAVTVDEEEVSAGTLIANGKTATLGDDTEFTAVWKTEINPTLSYDKTMLVLTKLISAAPTLTGNTGSGAVTWSSSAEGVATVDGSGNVTAVAAGTAEITASIAANGGYAAGEAKATIKVVAAPTHLIENRMATSGTWDSYILTDNAHVSNLKTIQASEGKTLIKSGKESASGSRTPGITSSSSSTLVEDDYIYIQFTIEDGYELAVSAINVPVFKIASGNGKYVARISDASNDIESEELTLAQNGVGNPFNEYNFSSSPKLSGAVTLKLFAYGYSDGYRMESPVYIDGTITAAGAPTSYSITYDCDGASSGCPSNLTEQTALPDPLPDAPTKSGYTFMGWYTNSAKTTAAVAGTALTGNTTMYAKWAVNMPGTLNKGNVGAVSNDMTYYSTNYFDFGPTDAPNLDRWAEWVVYLTPGKYSLSTTTTCSNGYGWRFSIKDTELTYDQPDLDGGTNVVWNSSSDWDLTSLSAGTYTIRVTNHREWSQAKLLSLTLAAAAIPVDYTITHSASSNGTYTIQVGEAAATDESTTANSGQTITLAATPASGYGLASWTVMNGETPVEVTGNTFTMPAGNVTVSATFAVEPNVYYYKSASHYDGSAYKNPEGNAHDVALSSSWTIVSGGTIAGVTSVVANGATFDDKSAETEKWVTSYIKLSKDDASQNITFTIASGYLATIKMKIGAWSSTPTIYLKKGSDVQTYTGTIGGVATTENNFNELTWSDLSAGVYVLNVANEGNKKNAYISQIDIQTTPVYTVTHTLTGVTTSSATKVDAGVAYNATYAAESGYTLPSTITVKVGGSTIDAENYTWNQATGELSIPAAQVTGNIQVIVVGDFTCPEAASGDVVFSWTPKTGLSDADIAAGTHDLPGSWLTSVNGGTAQIYVPSAGDMRIRGSQLAFNKSESYIHIHLSCALAVGDKILINSSGNTGNLRISTSDTKPTDVTAAAIIEQGTPCFITNSEHPLYNQSDLYIWRVSSTTQIGEVSIIRSKKFTVTYAAADLTAGEVPAAVTNIFDGKTIIVAGKGTMEKEGMFFNGWKDANEVSYAAGDDLEVTANMTLTAQWSQLYTVTYAKAGTEEGTVPTQESLLDGAKFNVADQGSLVTPADKVFGGWNDGSQTYAAGDEYTIAGANVILTAVWNNNYTVQYDANGGEGTMADGTGTTVSIAANGFTYADHKFLRWNSQPDGEGTNYAVGAEVSESLTLYAIWKEVICPSSGVIYSLAMKTGLANESVAHGQELPLTSEYATITGGEATLRNNDGSGDDKAQIYKSEVYFNGANAYLKVDMDCGPLAVGDEIVVTSENYENELYLTNTNNTSEKIETVSRSYTIVANDLLEGKSIFYIWRKSGGTSVGTITITRPAPDAPVPTISNATPADAEYTGAASAMTVSADAEAPKALHYQWYKEAGETDIEVGTDAASYTPTASGQYYCVVTNSPDGYTPKSATSRTATITMISSDATLAWLKADGNDIALSDGVYAYEYVIADNATVAPTITAGENEENATVTITQADSKTGTATIHVVAQDGETSHDYTVKFNEFSGCLTTFYFPYATDADNNHVTNNAQLRGHTVFTNIQSDGSGNGGTLTVNEVDYTVTRSTSSISSFGKLVVPEKYTATLYLLVKIGSANTSLQLVKDGESTPYMSSDVYAETGTYQYNFENIQAGTYVIRAWRNGNVQNCNYLAMAAELCRYEVSSVSLANMILRTGNTATPEMTITPAKGAVVSQAWSFVDAATAEAAGLSINATTGAITATEDATPGAYTVKVVLNGDNTLSATCTVTVLTEFSQVDVTGTTEWDFATGKAASARIDIGYGDKLLANVDGVTNDETFNSQALMVDANYVSNSQLQSKSVMFHATVPGLLTIRYACTSGKDADRVLYINDRETTSKTKTTSVIEYTQVVPAGDVTIKAMFGETPEVDIMNYKYIKFTAAEDLDPAEAEESTLGGYERTVNPQYYGTVCLPKAGVMTGAMLFQVAYMDYKDDAPYKVYYDQVENGVMQAGMPYIFLAEQSTIGVYYTGTAEETAKDHNGLHGTLTDITEGMNATGIYMLYNNQVLHSTNAASTLPANRAYLQISEIPGYGNPSYVAPAPKYRRISTGFNGANTATGMDEIEASETPMKIMIEGQIYIIRGEKMYDVTGKLVK